MRYDELRTVLRSHFERMLEVHTQRMSESGPLTPAQRQAVQTAADLGQLAVETDSPLLFTENDNARVLAEFMARNDLTLAPESQAYQTLARLLPMAYRDYALSLLKKNDDYQRFEYFSGDEPLQRPDIKEDATVTIVKLTKMYFEEGDKGGQWAGKTKFEKADHLDLLVELYGPEHNVRRITLQMAREVKETLLKYPRNRRKNPKTRNLPLKDAMAISGLQTINAQTINKYLQTYGTLFEWAKKNGFVAENVFAGLTIRSTKRAAVVRKPFTGAQIDRICKALKFNESGNIRLPYQKWGPLIGLYTGARLNEIAQIHIQDILQEDGLWYFDLNDDEGKKLKTAASKRAVPVHPRLIELGLIDYVSDLRSSRQPKLFPSFTYCTKNGWGRALGRWFNETFLPDLGIKSESLVFHSLRHTVTNSLQREGVPEPIVQAIIGHTRSNMLGQHYSASGFKLRQLHEALLRLPY